MNKKVAIVQSCYIPWKGYFDMMNMVDEFILFDHAQYTRRDWRNRNQIKTNEGLTWITIPVIVKGKYYQRINETKISDNNWSKKHWQIIVHNYSKAKYFQEYKSIFQETYKKCDEQYLSLINYKFIKLICGILDIKTHISWSTDYAYKENERNENLIDLCSQADVTEYISGPSAKKYLNKDLFESGNIKLSFMDYADYPEYNQLYPPFYHNVSILDLIFNQGPYSKTYMRSFK